MPRDRFHTGSEGKALHLRPLLLLEPLGQYSRHFLRAHGPPVDRLDAIDGLRHPGRPSAGGGGPRPVRRAKELSPPGGESRNLCAATVSHGRVPVGSFRTSTFGATSRACRAIAPASASDR